MSGSLMIEAIVLWDDPNTRSHWNSHLDPEWKTFAAMVKAASESIRTSNPDLPVVLGGVSSCDCEFLRRMRANGVLDHVDAVGVHGFPLDWDHWQIDEWPDRIAEAREAAGKPVWVLKAGASSFGSEEVQAFGLLKTLDLLHSAADRTYWYSLFDLPTSGTVEALHNELEESASCRRRFLGLLKCDGTPKLAADLFPTNGSVGLCQWFRFEDPRLYDAANWMHKHGVRSLRTGLNWADWFRPNGAAWFDRMIDVLHSFDVTLTLSCTPAHLGLDAHHHSPPLDVRQFAEFAAWVVDRYARYAPKSASSKVRQLRRRPIPA